VKTSLDHLPESKQAELKKAVSAIRKAMKPEMIILYGSYARGDFVESDKYKEGHITYEYQSDFDILVLVESEKLASDITNFHLVEKNVKKEVDTPFGLIIEPMQFVNAKIAEGRYFYADIRKEGVILYDSHKFKLVKPRELSPAEKKHMAEEDYELWQKKAVIALENYNQNSQKGDQDQEYLNKAAFELHQTTEALFTALLLVFTGYRPKSHDLQKLEEMVESFSPDIKNIFPRKTDADSRLFELLRQAYVDARYKANYSITKDELKTLVGQIDVLKNLVEKLCLEKIKQLGEAEDK